MKHAFTLVTFIDALGWEITNEHRFMDDFLTHRQPINTVFGYSCTCDPTIITGKLPVETGHFSFFVYDPKNSPFAPLKALRILPKSIFDRGRVRHWISRLLKWHYGYTGYFQIYSMPFEILPYFDYTEKRDLYQPGGINSGAFTIFDYLRENNIPFYLSDWRKPEEENIAALKHATRHGAPRFGYLYMAAMDGILHAVGTQSSRIAEKMAWYTPQLQDIRKHLEARYSDVQMIVISDHGMTNIHATSDLMLKIDKTQLVFGTDYAAVFDSTMARFWFLNDQARETISKILEDDPDGHILSETELTDYGCHFPDKRYGECFYLLDPGVLLCPGHLGFKPLAGMHGYDPFHKDSVASFLATSKPESPPKGLADLYGIMKTEIQRTAGDLLETKD